MLHDVADEFVLTSCGLLSLGCIPDHELLAWPKVVPLKKCINVIYPNAIHWVFVCTLSVVCSVLSDPVNN